MTSISRQARIAVARILGGVLPDEHLGGRKNGLLRRRAAPS
ncbi:hypothetical protein ACQ4WX_49115 [Streptomyces lasalocidi]